MNLVWILLASSALAQSVAPPAAPPAISARDAMRAALDKQQAAAARQREAIRTQAESVGVWLAPGEHVNGSPPSEPPRPASAAAEPAPQMPCDPIADLTVTPIIDLVAQAQDLEKTLLRAVIEQESAYRPCAVSPKGAKGLMQLMPDTAEQFGVKDPFDPQENIEAGAKYLKQLLDKYRGDLPQTLGAYNAGPAAVDRAGGVPDIPETRDYVKSIMQRLAPTRTDPPSIPPPKPIEN